MSMISSQMSLPGLAPRSDWFIPEAAHYRPERVQGYTLFLAVFPSVDDARRISERSAQLRRRHRLSGDLHDVKRLYVTLLTLAWFRHRIPQLVLDAAVAAASRVSCAPFPVVFNLAMSFAASNAFVLRPDLRSDAYFAQLRQMLACELHRVGFQAPQSRTAHMTVLYDPRRVDAHAVEPISWAATRFALVLSRVGARHHEKIAQWALAERGAQVQ